MRDQTDPVAGDTDTEQGDGPDLMLVNLSWPEVRDLQDDVEVVLIPVGAIEQHGPNLSLNFDIAHSTEVCRLVSQRLYPRVLVAPGPPFGVSFHHMRFPGTISFSPATLSRVLLEIVGSLHAHGFERFLFVNGHGGNIAALGVTVVDIQEAINPAFVGACSIHLMQDKAKWRDVHPDSGLAGHACEVETSVGMYLLPETVKADTLAPGEFTPLHLGFRRTLSKFGAVVPYRFDQLTTNGAWGDATLSTPEFGRDLTNAAVTNISTLVEELIEASPLA